MKLPIKNRRRGVPIHLLFAAAAAVFPATALAQSNWNADDGNWSNPNNWSPVGVPTSGTVSITDTDGLTRTITEDYTSPTAYYQLDISLSGGSPSSSETVDLAATNVSLATQDEYIGGYNGSTGNGIGTFNQSAGTNTIANFSVGAGSTNNLYLGYNSTDTGSYILSGSGSLSVSSTEDIGYNGSGSFNQGGGTNATGSLVLGLHAGSTGDYDLSGGSLSTGVGADEFIGENGSGNFTQSGGTNTSPFLFLAFDPGATGSYTLSGTGSLAVSSHEEIGHGGTGTFTQTGGVNSMNGTYPGPTPTGLIVATGTYNLEGTGLLTVSGAANEYLGFDISSTMNQSGGTNLLQGTSSLIMATWVGEAETYILSGTSSLTVGGSEYVGFTGAAVFTQTGGANILSGVNSTLVLGASNTAVGNYELSGGTVSLSATNALEIIGNYGWGVFNQSGGLNDMSNLGVNGYVGAFILGNNVGSTGTFILSGGETNIQGSVPNPQHTSYAYFGNEYIGYSGTGLFNQSGGSNTTTYLYLAYKPNSTGTYVLSGTGTLSTQDQYVGYSGTGTFIQSGGTNSLSQNNLYLGYLAGSQGSYTLNGGTNTDFGLDVGYGGSGVYTLSGTGSLASVGEIIGFDNTGTFVQTGGTNSVGSYGGLLIGSISPSEATYNFSSGILTDGGNFIVGAGMGSGFFTICNTGQLSVTGTMKVQFNGRANINGGNTSVGGLSIIGNGLVNMNAVMTINYAGATDPIATIVSYLRSGYNNGAWTGTAGIISTSAASGTAGPILSVGYADGNTDSGTPAGPNQILIQYTLAGDANLDGKVDFTDLGIVGQHLNTTGNDWAHGNFTYDPNGIVNFTDLGIIGQNLNQSLEANAAQTPPARTINFPANISNTAIPEPTTVALFIASAASLLTPRRRQMR